jgi:hypothetical protein
MSVTTKNNALLSETAYSKRYSLPPIFIGAGCLPLGFGVSVRLSSRRSLSRTVSDREAIRKTVRARAFFKAKPSFGRNSIDRIITLMAFSLNLILINRNNLLSYFLKYSPRRPQSGRCSPLLRERGKAPSARG